MRMTIYAYFRVHTLHACTTTHGAFLHPQQSSNVTNRFAMCDCVTIQLSECIMFASSLALLLIDHMHVIFVGTVYMCGMATS